jgi:hypothetical protein
MLVGITQWNNIKEAGFGDWYALTGFHIYDATVNAGTCPNWAKAMEQSNTFVIHEYAPGKIVYLRPEADLYMYFEDSPAPVIVQPDPTPNPVGCGTLTMGIMLLVLALPVLALLIK